MNANTISRGFIIGGTQYMQNSRKKAFITDWSIVDFKEAQYAKIAGLPANFPDCFFSDFNERQPVALFGRAVNDHRSNLATGEFTDGNTIFTSLICEYKDGLAITENTVYELGEINLNYQLWCELNEINWKNFPNRKFIVDTEKYEKELLLGVVTDLEMTNYISYET